MPRFGPAGNSESFATSGGKSLLDVPAFIKGMGLDAYEYQGGHGIRISKAMAEQFGEAASGENIALSIHAPYYISLASVDEEKRANSVSYILAAARAAKWMGAGRVVFHPGSCAKLPRSAAISLAKDTLRRALKALDAAGLKDISLCPETMGKKNQLGTVGEVLELCSLDERLIPCIDFGHVYARTCGGLKTRGDFKKILDAMEDKLGKERFMRFHSHFSRVEYTDGGEKQHLTFADKRFGPDFEPLAELVAEKGCAPVFICESRGTQAEDARSMKDIYKMTGEGES